MVTWVRNYSIENKDGIVWYAAPKPHWWHRCRAQSRGRLSTGTYYERCACGAIRGELASRWHNKNDRRKNG